MNVTALYFSPTGTTRKITEGIAKKIADKISGNSEIKIMDFTLKEKRNQPVSFDAEDLVILGVPVYAGRVPNVLLPYLSTITGNGAKAVCVVVYGNRNYDDALIELRDIATTDGFLVLAAGAFVGEHSFSKVLAMGRPDQKDMEIVELFASRIIEKINADKMEGPLAVKGEEPYRKYYMPRDRQGTPVDIRKVTPKTNSDCTNCKACVALCPMDSIDFEDPTKLTGICIKCGACLKGCPVSAKYYDDADYLRHQYELEEQFAARRAPELFI